MSNEFPARLFKPGTPAMAMWPFIGFAVAVIVTVTVLIVIRRFDLALYAAWAAMISEIILAIWRNARLRVPFGIVLALYGSIVIIFAAWVRSIAS